MAAQPPRPAAARPAAGAPLSSARDGPTAQQKPVGTYFLGRYRVVEEIGVGGMASVHLGRMDGPGGFQKWVAIKRIHANLVDDDQFVDMFLDEARIAAGINHANVAQVFDLGKDDNTYWIAMEYLHGEPLRELMRRCEERGQLISPDLAARICADAAEGLHAAHELRGKNGQLLGLVHRDVTPHNLFITYDGYTKVVDFGIAKVADRLSETRAGTLKGKLAYMSPEQVRAQDDVDRTTDIFALGVVLWELTTGHRLFRMDTDLDTLEKVQACIVPPPSTIIPGYPVELESVVMKALAKKKPERFQTARELSRALQTYLLRRGVFVGPEEVAAVVRDLFSDRIKSREDHLAWAADVTSTINIDQLKAGKTGAVRDDASKNDLSRKGSNFSDDGAPTGRKGSGQGASRRHKSIPAPKGGRGSNPSNSEPPSTSKDAPPRPPPPPPTTREGTGISLSGSMSLLDDDEDVPTTVATREHMMAAAADKAQEGNRGAPPSTGHMQPSAQGQFIASTGRNDAANGQHAARGGLGAMPPPPPLPAPVAAQEAQKRGTPFGGTLAMSPEQNPLHQYEKAQRDAAAKSGPYPTAAANQPYSAPTFGAPPTFGSPPGFGGYQQHGAPVQSGSFPSMSGAQQYQHGMGQQPQPQHHDPYGRHPNYGQPTPGQGSPPSSSNLKETAPSLARQDPGSWLADNNPARQKRKNTAVLVAVALLTAVCVAAIAALIWLKIRASSPSPDKATSDGVAADSSRSNASPGSDTASATTTKLSTAVAVNASASPSAAPGDAGFLTVICKPFCDTVKRDKDSLGPSPIVKSPTSPGHHQITMSRTGCPDHVETVTIAAGEVRVMHVNMP